jgi:hypothetical protein
MKESVLSSTQIMTESVLSKNMAQDLEDWLFRILNNHTIYNMLCNYIGLGMNERMEKIT